MFAKGVTKLAKRAVACKVLFRKQVYFDLENGERAGERSEIIKF